MSTLIADTGGLLRALARDARGRPSWPEYTEALLRARGHRPVARPRRGGSRLADNRPAMRRLVGELLDPGTTYELEPVRADDIARALALDEHFSGLRLGLVDGMVAAIAERRGVRRVLTTDRDFSAVRIGRRLQLRLELVP